MDEKELTRRALEVCKTIDLDEMEAAGSYDPTNSGKPFEVSVRRFMVWNCIDRESDVPENWVSFEDTREEAAARIAEFAESDWSVVGVYDLERDDYAKQLKFSVTATIEE